MSSKQIDKLFLMAEALLIVMTLATGGKALVGMICYWSLVAVYHLLDYLFERKGKDDGN